MLLPQPRTHTAHIITYPLMPGIHTSIAAHPYQRAIIYKAKPLTRFYQSVADPNPEALAAQSASELVTD